jgi:hypothetical protein
MRDMPSGQKEVPITSMFEQLDDGPSFGSWVFQLLLAYFGPLVLLMITWAGLVTGEDSPGLTLCEYVFIALISSAIASIVSTIASRATVEGRWVWVFPTALFLVVLVDAASRNMGEVKYMFYVGPGEGEAGWGLMLLTMPTWSCCCYSLAMNLRRRHNGPEESSHPAP